MLDLIGKATPGTFQPSLQIDGTGAKLLIEALSGRWSYDAERRDKKTVWHYVANAFSLLVSTIASMPSNEQIKVISVAIISRIDEHGSSVAAERRKPS